MNENEFEYEGKAFIAVDSDAGCYGCYFEQKDCCGLQDDRIIPNCFGSRRQDKTEVMFTEKGADK